MFVDIEGRSAQNQYVCNLCQRWKSLDRNNVLIWKFRCCGECHSELREALGNRSLPYRTVARWAAAFQHGRFASAYMRRTGRPKTVSTDVARAVIAQCLEDGLYRSYKNIQVLIRQLCIISYEKICMCVGLLQSRCHMHLLNNKKIVSLWNLYSSGKVSKWREIGEQHYHYWWNLGQGLWTWVKAPVSWMETWRITAKTEISSEFIFSKVNGNFGLWCPGSDFVSFCATWWNC